MNRKKNKEALVRTGMAIAIISVALLVDVDIIGNVMTHPFYSLLIILCVSVIVWCVVFFSGFDVVDQELNGP